MRLRRRSEFLAAARPARARDAFVLQACRRRARARRDDRHRPHRHPQDRQRRDPQPRPAPPARGAASGPAGPGAPVTTTSWWRGRGADLPVRRSSSAIWPAPSARSAGAAAGDEPSARLLVGLVTGYRWLVSPVLGSELPLRPVLLRLRYRGAAPARGRARRWLAAAAHRCAAIPGAARLRPGAAAAPRRPLIAAALRSFPPS